MFGCGRVIWLGIAVCLLVASAMPSGAQEIRALKLTDSPTAEVMERGVYDLNLVAYPEGGLLLGIRLGLMPRFTLGVNYGGLRLIGSGNPDWNPRVEFNARYQLAAESYSLPALAIGFDSQGFGSYDNERERYQVKSKGFYAVATRNYSFMGRVAFHGGLNYSLEDGDHDTDLNFFFGLEKSLGPDVTLGTEYDSALNDGGDWDTGGRLNASLVWTYAERLRLQVDVRNILRVDEGELPGGEPINHWSRGIQLAYRESF
jgi:hypothetical protein